MAPCQLIEVKIGEVKTGRNDDVLQTTLGSCVGIAVLWPANNVYGLAHCLLPEAPVATSTIGAKYVDQAVLSLFYLMKLKPEHFGEITVHIAGGANMFAQLNRKDTHIGSKNTEAAERIFAHHDIDIARKRTGGVQARRMIVRCKDATVTVKTLDNRSTGKK